MLYDKVYVLAKGGQAVYAGKPQDLPQYLIDCDIECTKKQVPIEVLLKHSCNGINDKIVQKMVIKTQDSEKNLVESRLSETTPFPDGVKRLSKRFYLRDLWILFMRSLSYTFRHTWKLLIIQFFLFMSFAVTLQFFYGKDVGRPTGCISYDEDFNNTCAKTEEKLAEETLLLYNIKYLFYVVIIVLFFTIILTTMTFTMDLKIFFNEQRNGEKFNLIISLFLNQEISGCKSKSKHIYRLVQHRNILLDQELCRTYSSSSYISLLLLRNRYI